MESTESLLTHFYRLVLQTSVLRGPQCWKFRLYSHSEGCSIFYIRCIYFYLSIYISDRHRYPGTFSGLFRAFSALFDGVCDRRWRTEESSLFIAGNCRMKPKYIVRCGGRIRLVSRISRIWVTFYQLGLNSFSALRLILSELQEQSVEGHLLWLHERRFMTRTSQPEQT